MPKAKQFNTDARERCDRADCGHFHILHGNGSRAHNNSTACITAGCRCTVFLEAPFVQSEPRTRFVKTLDRAEPQLFDVATIG